jgi:hypothetical protein
MTNQTLISMELNSNEESCIKTPSLFRFLCKLQRIDVDVMDNVSMASSSIQMQYFELIKNRQAKLRDILREKIENKIDRDLSEKETF